MPRLCSTAARRSGEVKRLAFLPCQNLLGSEGKRWLTPWFQTTVVLAKTCTSYRLFIFTRVDYDSSGVNKKYTELNLILLSTSAEAVLLFR